MLYKYTHINIRDNKDHEIDWEKKLILDKEIHFEKRKIKEAIYINAFDNGTLMNPDKKIPINQCWTEFFPFKTEVKGYVSECIYFSFITLSIF